MNAYNTDQLTRMEPGYLGNYGLREAPFSAIHKDKFLYLDAERAQRLNLLQHMTQYSNLLLIVQGERGAGKTSLLTRFVNNAENEWSICQVAANTMMDAEQLLFQAAQGFGIDQLPQDAAQLQEMLYARVATMHHNDQIPILIIDDAHELPKDALLAIFNLADTYVDEEHLLRIILFCEPQIEKILGTKDVKVLRERITHTMEIPALDEDTTAEYLKHRLAVAGFTGGSPFTPKMIKRIYKASRGLPGVINELAHETLEHGDFDKNEQEDIVTIHSQTKQPKPIVYISVAVVLIAIVLVFQDKINQIFNDEQAQQQAVEVAEQHKENDPLPAAAETPAVSPFNATESSKEKLQQKIIPLNPEALAEKAQQPDVDLGKHQEKVELQTSTEKAATEEIKTEVVSGTPPPVPLTTEPNLAESEALKPVQQTLQLFNIEPENLPGSVKPQVITLNGQGFTPNTDVIVSWTGKEKKLAAHQISIESESVIKVTINVGRNADNWSLRVTDPEKGKSNLLGFKVTAAEDDLLKGDKWVLARSPEAFTLQLFGTNQQQNADQFISRHAINDQAAYFHILRSGQDWYSVVYGEYHDQEAAKRAIQSLPVSLKKIKPWVRRFDDIHASINASRKLVAKKTRKPKKIPLATSSLPKNATAEQHASWLWNQDPRSFTLQILGARSSDSVNQFLHKYTDLNGKAVYFHTRHNARDWYTVVYGVYQDKESAKKAIDRLPAELKSSSPWVRSFASIHAELDRAE